MRQRNLHFLRWANFRRTFMLRMFCIEMICCRIIYIFALLFWIPLPCSKCVMTFSLEIWLMDCVCVRISCVCKDMCSVSVPGRCYHLNPAGSQKLVGCQGELESKQRAIVRAHRGLPLGPLTSFPTNTHSPAYNSSYLLDIQSVTRHLQSEWICDVDFSG